MTYNTKEDETYCDFCEMVLTVGDIIIVCDEAVGGTKSEDCYGMHLCDKECWEDHIKEVHAGYSFRILDEKGEAENKHDLL